jgi:hypothetical protein
MRVNLEDFAPVTTTAEKSKFASMIPRFQFNRGSERSRYDKFDSEAMVVAWNLSVAKKPAAEVTVDTDTVIKRKTQHHLVEYYKDYMDWIHSRITMRPHLVQLGSLRDDMRESDPSDHLPLTIASASTSAVNQATVENASLPSILPQIRMRAETTAASLPSPEHKKARVRNEQRCGTCGHKRFNSHFKVYHQKNGGGFVCTVPQASFSTSNPCMCNRTSQGKRHFHGTCPCSYCL